MHKKNIKKLVCAICMVLLISELVCDKIYHETCAQEIVSNNVPAILNPVVPDEPYVNWHGSYVYYGHYPQSLINNPSENIINANYTNKSLAKNNYFNINKQLETQEIFLESETRVGQDKITRCEKLDDTNQEVNYYKQESIKWRVLDKNNKSYKSQNDFIKNNYDPGNQNAPIDSNGILLMSNSELDHVAYHTVSSTDNASSKLSWSGSDKNKLNCSDSDQDNIKTGCTLWAWLNAYDNKNIESNQEVPENYFIRKAFSDRENKNILSTKVYTLDPGYRDNSSPRTSQSEDKLFLLSYNEAINPAYGFYCLKNYLKENLYQKSFSSVLDRTDYEIFKSSDENIAHWLRSPAFSYKNNIFEQENQDLAFNLRSFSDKTLASNVLISYMYNNKLGGVSKIGFPVEYADPAFAPALNLDLNSVLFVSMADDSNKNHSVSNNLNKFTLNNNLDQEYKFTLLEAQDSDKNNLEIINQDSLEDITNQSELNFEYKNAVSNNYIEDITNQSELNFECQNSVNYISCVITQEAISSDNIKFDDVKYYGKVAELKNSQGSFSIKIPDITGQIKLKIFLEECNGPNETDFAGNPVIYNLNITQAPEPTSSPEPTNSPVPTSSPEPTNSPVPTPTTLPISSPTSKPHDSRFELITLRDIKLPENLKTNKFLRGYPSGLFMPDANLTRAEAAQMLFNLTYDNSQITYKSLDKFSDMKKISWYTRAVAYFAGKNLINGSDGKFHPNDKILRSEMAQFLFNVLKDYADNNTKLIYGESPVKLKDIEKNIMAEAIKQLASNNIISGYADNSFHPNKHITRAEITAMITKAFNITLGTDLIQKFPDVNKKHWAFDFITSAAI